MVLGRKRPLSRTGLLSTLDRGALMGDPFVFVDSAPIRTASHQRIARVQLLNHFLKATSSTEAAGEVPVQPFEQFALEGDRDIAYNAAISKLV